MPTRSLPELFGRVFQAKHGRAARKNPGRTVLAIEALERRHLLASTIAIQSGNWSNPTTWSNGVPDATARAIIGQGRTVTLDGLSSIAKEIVVQGTLSVAEGASGSADRTLSSDWIHINSNGVFQIGTAANRYDANNFILTLTGTDPTADFVIETATGTTSLIDNNGFVMTGSGGRLQFFGQDKLSFTKLAATVLAGSTSITVANVIERNFDGTTSAASDGSLNWQVGDQIVVASSSTNYNHQDVRTITAITAQATTSVLTLSSALTYRHYGEIETYSNPSRSWSIDMRAEVALLSRNIKIQGTQDTDRNFGDRANYGTTVGKNLGIGGHVMMMHESGQITLDGVQFDKLGQTGTVGRYPVHFHEMGNRTGDVMRNSSVTNSNNRGVAIHGTQNLLLQGNVLHDIHGHGFFIEDAAETGNRFLNNIAFGIHKVGGGVASNDPFVIPGITRGSDGKVNGFAPRNGNGESSHDTGQNFNPRFVHSAAFWITNPDNTFVGNISAGSEGTGFWFALPNRVLGLSKDTGLYDSLVPRRTNLKQFDFNTSHSAKVGLTFDRGEDILPGSSNNYEPPVTMQINNFTGYQHDGSAVYHRASFGIFNESRFADNAHSSFNTFNQEERNILFVGHSRGNSNPSAIVGGFRLYDGPGTIRNSHFAGFAAANAHMFRVEGGANKHSHTRAQGITFEADGSGNHLSIEWATNAVVTTNNSPSFVAGRPDSWSGLVLDMDGSLTGAAGGGVNSVLTPKIDIFRDSNDIAPAGWNAYISNDRFAQLKIGTIDDLGTVPNYRIENSVGNAIVANNRNLAYIQRQYAKLNAGDYTVSFTEPIPAAGWEVFLQTLQGGAAGDATVFRFLGGAVGYKPSSGTARTSLASLRSATNTSYYRDYDGHLWMKVFASAATIQIVPTADPLPTNPQSAFVARTVTNGTRIEAEEYDNGGPNIAYRDTTTGNAGSTTFRTTENVDAQPTTDVGGGFNLSHTANGEWLEYTADVVAGVYNIDFRLAASATTAKSLRIRIADGGVNEVFTELGVIAIPATGGTQNWTTLTLKDVDLSAWGGTRRVFRVEVIGGSYNLNWMEFTRSQAAYTQRTVTGGTRIEAEAYDIGGQGFAYSDTTTGNVGGQLRTSDDADVYTSTDVGGGFVIGNIANGEWLEYTTDVVAGIYNIRFRLAATAAGRTLRLLIADSETATTFTLLGTVTVPVTGSFSTWQTATLVNVNLSAWQGTDRVLRLEMTGGSFNMNWFEFVPAPAVVGRGISYGGAEAAYGPDAIDPSKQALLPGGAASFANYTNYVRGINRIVVDVANMTGTPTASDFQFATWNGIVAAGFTAAASIPTISILSGGGVGGASRIKIEFADNAIQNTWLRVTMLANANTGLSANDVFYFGNVIGEFNTGNTDTRLRVNATDTGAVRSNQSTASNSALVTNIYDVNRDGRVNATDTGIVRSNQQTSGIVAPITVPLPPSAPPPTSAPLATLDGEGFIPLPPISITREVQDKTFRLDQDVLTATALKTQSTRARFVELPNRVNVGRAANVVTSPEAKPSEELRSKLESLDHYFATLQR